MTSLPPTIRLREGAKKRYGIFPIQYFDPLPLSQYGRFYIFFMTPSLIFRFSIPHLQPKKHDNVGKILHSTYFKNILYFYSSICQLSMNNLRCTNSSRNLYEHGNPTGSSFVVATVNFTFGKDTNYYHCWLIICNRGTECGNAH